MGTIEQFIIDTTQGAQTADDLFGVYRQLLLFEAIARRGDSIVRAGMNVTDNPFLRRYVPTIALDLYRTLRESGIVYDALVSCPTGGDAWADALTACVRTERNDVASYRLCKAGLKRFRMPESAILVGTRCLLVDDTLYSGTAALNAQKTIEGAGCTVVGLVVPVEVGTYGRDKLASKNVTVISTFNDEFIENLYHRQERRTS